MDKIRFSVISDIAIKWCVFAVVFAVPFSKSISEIAITTSIALWVVNKILKRDYRIDNSDLAIPLLIFVMVMIPSFFNSEYLALSVKAVFTKVLKYVFFYFVIVDSMNTKAKLKDLFVVTILSVVIVALDGLIQYFCGGIDMLHFPGYPSFKARSITSDVGFFRGFPTACFPYPNDFATWILLVISPIASCAMFGLRKRYSWYLGTLSLILFYLLFLTKARGAWVGIGVSTVYIALLKNRKWLIIFLIVVLAVPFLLKMEMSQYIFGGSSVGDRFFMWGTGWEIYKNHPIIGNGINTFFVNFMKYRKDEWRDKKGSYAHNCYLQMAADTGVIGLAGFIWLMLAYFISIGKSLNKIKDQEYASVLLGISMGVLSFLVMGFFDTNYYSLNLVTLFWCAIGISGSIIKVCAQETA